MIRYLDGAEVAHRLGLSAQSVRRLRSEGRMPEPDAMIGRQPGWLPSTIDAWTDKPKPRAKRL